MASDELLGRIEGHMERGNELMERNRVAFEESREAFRHMMEAFDRWERREDEHQEFIRSMTERNEQVTRQLVRAIGDAFGGLQKQMQEHTEQLEANTRAAWRLLDRFGPAQPEG